MERIVKSATCFKNDLFQHSCPTCPYRDFWNVRVNGEGGEDLHCSLFLSLSPPLARSLLPSVSLSFKMLLLTLAANQVCFSSQKCSK